MSECIDAHKLYELTLNHDVIAIPEEIIVGGALEHTLLDCSSVFPVRPSSPILPEVPRVSKLFGTVRQMRECILAVRFFERAKRVVVVLREDQDVALVSFAQ